MLTVSVGVAQAPEHGDTLEALRSAADTALYDAKGRGRNIVRFFNEPAPIAEPEPRETARKAPASNGLSAEEEAGIRESYFRSGRARCPKDQAKLRVTEADAMGDRTVGLLVLCPMCGLNAYIE